MRKITITSFLLMLILMSYFTISPSIFPRAIVIFALGALIAAVVSIRDKRVDYRFFVSLAFGIIFFILTDEVLYLLFALSFFFSCKFGFPVNKNLLLGSLVISGFGILFNLLIYSEQGASVEKSRTGIGTDPNFSALIVFFWLVLTLELLKITRRIMFLFVLLLIVAVVSATAYYTASRNFVLMSLLLVAFYVWNEFGDNIFKTKFLIFLKSRVIFTYAILTVFLIGFSIYAITSISFFRQENLSILERIQTLNDTSNLGRFAANRFWAIEIFDSHYIISGLYSGEEMKYVGNMLPHNSAIHAVAYGSWLYLIMSLWFIKNLSANLSPRSISLVLFPYLVGSLFLHAFFSPFFLLLLAVTGHVLDNIQGRSNTVWRGQNIGPSPH